MEGSFDVVGNFFSCNEITQAARGIKIQLFQVVLSIFGFRINFRARALSDLGGKLEAGIEVSWRFGQHGSGKRRQEYQSGEQNLEHGRDLPIGTGGLEDGITQLAINMASTKKLPSEGRSRLYQCPVWAHCGLGVLVLRRVPRARRPHRIGTMTGPKFVVG